MNWQADEYIESARGASDRLRNHLAREIRGRYTVTEAMAARANELHVLEHKETGNAVILGYCSNAVRRLDCRRTFNGLKVNAMV